VGRTLNPKNLLAVAKAGANRIVKTPTAALSAALSAAAAATKGDFKWIVKTPAKMVTVVDVVDEADFNSHVKRLELAVVIFHAPKNKESQALLTALPASMLATVPLLKVDLSDGDGQDIADALSVIEIPTVAIYLFGCKVRKVTCACLFFKMRWLTLSPATLEIHHRWHGTCA
jgi:hypothetical protein